MSSLCSSQAARDAYTTLRAFPLERLKAHSGASDAVLDDYLKFIACKAATGDYFASLLSCPPEVDGVWHEHLLDTLSYHEMCEAIVPGRFIHHNPDGASNEDARAERRMRALGLYERIFGVPPAYWRAACRKRTAPSASPAAGSSSRRQLRVYIKSNTGKTITIDNLEPDTPMTTVHHAIQDKEGIPPDQQRLIYAGKSVGVDLPCIDSLRQSLQRKTVAKLRADCNASGLGQGGKKADLVKRLATADMDKAVRDSAHLTLAAHHIRDGSTLHLVLRLRGC